MVAVKSDEAVMKQDIQQLAAKKTNHHWALDSISSRVSSSTLGFVVGVLGFKLGFGSGLGLGPGSEFIVGVWVS